jgi:hypothetical protein
MQNAELLVVNAGGTWLPESFEGLVFGSSLRC